MIFEQKTMEYWDLEQEKQIIKTVADEYGMPENEVYHNGEVSHLVHPQLDITNIPLSMAYEETLKFLEFNNIPVDKFISFMFKRVKDDGELINDLCRQIDDLYKTIDYWQDVDARMIDKKEWEAEKRYEQWLLKSEEEYEERWGN